MIPFVNMSQEDWSRLQQAYQGPKKPPAMWKRVCAALIRWTFYGVFGVLFCGPLAIIGLVWLFFWAIDVAEDA